MTQRSFDDFVKSQVNVDKEQQLEIARELAEWRTFVHELHAKVREFLNEYTESGQIVISQQKKQITEEQTGPYLLQALIVTIGKRVVHLDPIGTFLIGTKGRVDMVGPRSTIRLILTDKDAKGPNIKVSIRTNGQPEPAPEPPKKIDWVWKIVVEQPRIRYLELTRDNFLNALMEVADG